MASDSPAPSSPSVPVEELERLEREAAAPPWSQRGRHFGYAEASRAYLSATTSENAALIVAMRNALPGLLARLRASQEENARLRAQAENLNDTVMLGLDKIATIALLQEWGAALNEGKPYPDRSGNLLLNAADMMINLAQHLKRSRQDVTRLAAEGARLREAIQGVERGMQKMRLYTGPGMDEAFAWRVDPDDMRRLLAALSGGGSAPPEAPE